MPSEYDVGKNLAHKVLSDANVPFKFLNVSNFVVSLSLI